MAKGKSFTFGIIAGGAIGAAAALLSTPDSGQGLRNRVKDQSLEWKGQLNTLKNKGIDLQEQLAQTSKDGVMLVRNLTREMKYSLTAWRETMEPHQENIQEYLEQIESSLKELEDKVHNQNQTN